MAWILGIRASDGVPQDMPKSSQERQPEQRSSNVMVVVVPSRELADVNHFAALYARVILETCRYSSQIQPRLAA